MTEYSHLREPCMYLENMRKLRKEKNLSQEAFAQLLGIAKNIYVSYEFGQQSPQLVMLEKIAEIHGVTLGELLGTNEPTTNDRMKAKLNLIETLAEDEKQSLLMVIEGLLLRHQSRSLQGEF